MTKTKKHRLAKKRNPQPKKLPHKYIDPNTPVKISPTADRPSLATPEAQERISHYLPARSKTITNDAPPLRFHFTSLEEEMSPNLKKMFHLTNASTSELARVQKAKAMEMFQLRPGDTGSSAVQIIALTNRIQQVQKHVTTHKKDYSGKRGLDALYVTRRKMLDYLERTDIDSYKTVVNALGLVR
jgi:small subunit ribosomal protein S15